MWMSYTVFYHNLKENAETAATVKTWAAFDRLTNSLQESAIDGEIFTISILKDVQCTLHRGEHRMYESQADIDFIIDSFKVMSITFNTFRGYTSIGMTKHDWAKS